MQLKKLSEREKESKSFSQDAPPPTKESKSFSQDAPPPLTPKIETLRVEPLPESEEDRVKEIIQEVSNSQSKESNIDPDVLELYGHLLLDLTDSGAVTAARIFVRKHKLERNEIVLTESQKATAAPLAGMVGFEIFNKLPPPILLFILLGTFYADNIGSAVLKKSSEK